jgi:hypothetical protein
MKSSSVALLAMLLAIATLSTGDRWHTKAPHELVLCSSNTACYLGIVDDMNI